MTATLTPVRASREVESKLDEARRLGEDRYRSVLFELADGGNVDAAEINAVLSSTARSQDDLRRHLSVAENRRDAVNAAGKLAELTPERDAAETTASKLYAEIEQERREFEERLAPKLAEQQAAFETSRRLKREIESLQFDAKRVLNSTASPELRAEFRQLSDRSCRLAAEVDQAKSAAFNFDARLAEADANLQAANETLARWDAEPVSEIRVDGLASAKQRVAAAIEARSELLSLVGKHTNAVAAHAEAVAALDEFLATEWVDWRQMDFA